jgi:hypothetical protein
MPNLPTTYLQKSIRRFARFCQHCPYTGCVIWTGTTVNGSGGYAYYGRFSFHSRKILAHRFAAEHLLNLPLTPDLQVDHKCGNTLCQHHLQVITPALNRELQWVRVAKGLDRHPDILTRQPSPVPFYQVPDWLAPYHPLHTCLSETPF